MAKPTKLQEVLLKDRMNLTIYKAVAYLEIGVNRINAMVKEPNCSFVL